MLKSVKALAEFISNHTIEFSSLTKFIQIMLSTSPNTSDVKRRNQLKVENMETLFILANLKLPAIKKPTHYIKEIKYLEIKINKRNVTLHLSVLNSVYFRLCLLS